MTENTGKFIDHSEKLAGETPPEEDLADNVTTERSIRFGGALVAVAEKDGNHVCWCCFDILGNEFIDLKMNEAIIRVCPREECKKKVSAANGKRSGERLRVGFDG